MASGRLVPTPGRSCGLGELQLAVVVAMPLMWMVQVTFDEIVHVVAVRNGFVTASGAVLMVGVVSLAVVIGGAA